MITLKTNLKVILVALLFLAVLLAIKFDRVEESIADPQSVSDVPAVQFADSW